jgi:hypothetical protein
MRGFGLLVAIVAALLVPAPAGASTVAEADLFVCWPAPSPGRGWIAVDYGFGSCGECEAAGVAGVSSGGWEAFRCGFFPSGIDGVYRLYVPSVRLAADPYVDAIAPDNQVEVLNGSDLIGSPDGRFATVRGQFGQHLVLDLGAGEEGVGDLEVRFTNPAGTLTQTMDVHFLDQNGQDLGQGQLVMVGMGAHTTTVDNPSTQPYRYLSILVGLRTAGFDSMRASALAR